MPEREPKMQRVCNGSGTQATGNQQVPKGRSFTTCERVTRCVQAWPNERQKHARRVSYCAKHDTKWRQRGHRPIHVELSTSATLKHGANISDNVGVCPNDQPERGEGSAKATNPDGTERERESEREGAPKGARMIAPQFTGF